MDAVLTRFHLGPTFDAVISGDSVSRAKPAPDIFLLAAERLGVRCDEAVVLDVMEAIEAGGA